MGATLRELPALPDPSSSPNPFVGARPLSALHRSDHQVRGQVTRGPLVGAFEQGFHGMKSLPWRPAGTRLAKLVVLERERDAAIELGRWRDSRWALVKLGCMCTCRTQARSR